MKPHQLLLQEKSAYAKKDPPCPYFGTCGGCSLQDLSYPDQLILKSEQLQRCFASIDVPSPINIAALENPWRYRNKAEFTFGALDGKLVLGYHAARSFSRIVDLEDCLLLPEPMMRVMRDVKALASETQMPAYNPKTHQGFFRYLIVRISQETGRIAICLITTSGERELMENMADALIKLHPEVSSMYWGLNSRPSDVAYPQELFLLRGAEYLDEQFGEFRLKVHPLSFLQPTRIQATRIYESLCNAIPEYPIRVAWDLYCGAGLIAFYLSQKAETVYAVDIETQNFELARVNASLNDLGNIELRLGCVETLMLDRRFWLGEARPDVVAVDPPRAGLHMHTITSVLAARPKFLAYISCNPSSLARDIRQLTSSFPRYRIVSIQAFDMFAQTAHLEVLALLSRTSGL